MHFAKPLFAPPAKRLVASSIDAAIAGCCAWFLVNVITHDWYAYDQLAIALPAAYWMYESACLIAMRGGSLGRRLFDIQVVSAVGNPDLAWWQAILRPGVRVALFACLVIYFARTPAEKLDVALFPVLVEAALLFLPFSLTVADVVARTRVVTTPPPQPHRAPAGPMYSASDAEFGPAPRRHR